MAKPKSRLVGQRLRSIKRGFSAVITFPDGTDQHFGPFEDPQAASIWAKAFRAEVQSIWDAQREQR